MLHHILVVEGYFGVERMRDFWKIHFDRVDFDFLLDTVVGEEFIKHSVAQINKDHIGDKCQPLGHACAFATLPINGCESWFDVNIVIGEEIVQMMYDIELL